MTTPAPGRNRVVSALGMALAATAGIASRRGWEGGAASSFVEAYAGDTLWALFVFLAIGAVFRRWPTARVALAAGIVSVAVELLQLFHPPWLEAVRGTTLGGLTLGHGFLWSDLLCYAAGIGIGAGAELALTRQEAE